MVIIFLYETTCLSLSIGNAIINRLVRYLIVYSAMESWSYINEILIFGVI